MSMKNRATLIGSFILLSSMGVAVTSCAPRLSETVPDGYFQKVLVLKLGSPPQWTLGVIMEPLVPDQSGCVTIPVKLDDDCLIIPNVEMHNGLIPDQMCRVDAEVDTGSAYDFNLSTDVARKLQPWLSAKVSASKSWGMFGETKSWSGFTGSVQLGNMRVEPAPIEVGSYSEDLNIGLAALQMLCDGVVFDWPRSQIELVIKKNYLSTEQNAAQDNYVNSLAGRDEWMVVPLVKDSESSDRPANAKPHSQNKAPKALGGSARIPIQVGDKTYVAAIDTGAVDDVILCGKVDWPLDTTKDYSIVRDIANHRSILATSQSAVPLRIGDHFSYDSVQVLSGWNPQPELYDKTNHYDVIIGMGILKRQPIWLDFKNGVVRFWNGDEPLPEPPNATSAKLPGVKN